MLRQVSALVIAFREAAATSDILRSTTFENILSRRPPGGTVLRARVVPARHHTSVVSS